MAIVEPLASFNTYRTRNQEKCMDPTLESIFSSSSGCAPPPIPIKFIPSFWSMGLTPIELKDKKKPK